MIKKIAITLFLALPLISLSAAEFIVKLSSNDIVKANTIIDKDGRVLTIKRKLVDSMNIYLVSMKDEEKRFRSNEAEAESIGQTKGISYAQEDHKVTLRSVPNDSDYDQQWSLNTQSNESDISAEKAWKITTGGSDKLGNKVVVAVIDGGFDRNHEDLIDNMWINKNEIPDNGKDDDNNGYIDDVYGWNAYTHSGKLKSNSHGTHVAGIIGAKGNNEIGVTGINWNVEIMPIAGSSRTTSTVMEAYGYVLKQKELWIATGGAKGANIVATNSSFGVDFANCNKGSYPLWNDIYNEMGRNGILSVAATANQNIDVDSSGDVPTGCDSDYIISVTNTEDDNDKAYSAAYGKTTIDLGAPGTDILSTTPYDRYREMTGTSMATPHVAGAVGLLHSAASKKLARLFESDPSRAALELKEIILSTVSPVRDLKRKTVTGGKLNLYQAARKASRF